MRFFYKSMRILALFLAILLLCSYFPACFSQDAANDILVSQISIQEPEPIQSSEKETLPDLSGIDKELADVFLLPDDYKEPPPDSYELIQKAFSEGKIKREEAAMLSVFAEYDPDRLPEEYRSNEPLDSAQFEIRYLVKNWDKLPKEVKDAVEPYLLPITDPRSFFNPQNRSREKGQVSGLTIISPALAAGDEYTFFIDEFTHDGQKFEISYMEEGSWPEAAKKTIAKMPEYVKASIIYAWDKFRPFMNTKPSMPYLIELVKMPAGSFGEEWNQNGKYRIRLNYSYAGQEKLMKSTTAHELFHSFQEELKLGFDKTDEKWLTEATAVWSENYVYSDYNVEHMRHPGFFRTLAKERIGFGNCFEYQSYMLFYYLTDYAGVNFIRDIIYTAGKKGNNSIRPYLMDKIPAIKDTYAEFARYNWNMTPVKKYYDHGPVNGNPNGKCLRKKILKVDQEDEVTVSLEPGGIMYYYYIFDKRDQALQHVTVTFDGTLEDEKYLKRQALVKIDGNWSVEDWSKETFKEYCRRRESKNEKIEALVLIYSNANLEDMLVDIDRFKVQTGKCPKEMELSMTAEFSYKVPGFEWKTKSTMTETLEIKEHCFYLVKAAQYSFSGEGFMDGNKLIETSGGFSTSIEKPDLMNSMSRILKNTAENIKGTKEAYEKFGISDNIPPEGIFITIPSLLDGVSYNGNTALYFPEPVGTINMSDPYPFDGISQILAIVPDRNDWSSHGINISTEIDYFSHKCPIINMFSVDYSKMTEQLKNLKNMPGAGSYDLPDSDEFKDAMKMFEDATGGKLPFGGGNTGSTVGDSPVDALMQLVDAMVPGRKPQGGSATVKIEVNGVYTKFN